MRTIWQSLAWKEWHEHKWKFVSMTTILCGVVALVMNFANEKDRMPMAGGLLMVIVVPLAVFAGLASAAGESSRQTLPFLQSLPTSLRQVAAVKLLAGILAIFAAIFFAASLIYIWSLAANTSYETAFAAVNRSTVTGSWFADVLLMAGAMSASFYLWTAAAGINRSDEVSAGVVAL